jgi:hypothetical protein
VDVLKRAAVFHGGLWLAWCSVVTSGLALAWRYPEAFGGWWVGPAKVFAPGQFVLWYGLVHPDDRWALHVAAVLCLAFGGMCAWKAWRAGRDGTVRPGTDRFQESEDDLRKSGLL